MSASNPATVGHTLRSVMTYADAEAQRLLDHPGPIPLDAVAWLSAHIAAVDHAVFPVVRRAVPDGRNVVAKQRTVASGLMKMLRIVERHRSGDVLAAGMDQGRIHEVLRQHVTSHQQAQSELVDLLEAALPEAKRTILMTSYEQALEHAPTRPHLHMSHGGMMFRLDAMRDKVLDTMDGRQVTVPRVARRRIIPGRWGSYFMGGPHDPDHS